MGRSIEMISVLYSRMPLQDELRARVKDGTVTLNGVAIAAHYLQNEFDASYIGNLAWRVAANAVEAATADANMIPHATRAMRHLLVSEGRFVSH
jgi:hypothetical protein